MSRWLRYQGSSWAPVVLAGQKSVCAVQRLCDKPVCSVRKNTNTKVYASSRPPMDRVTWLGSAHKYLSKQPLCVPPFLCITHDIITMMHSVCIDFLYSSYMFSRRALLRTTTFKREQGSWVLERCMTSRKPADRYVHGSRELLLLHLVLFNTFLLSCSFLQKKPLKLKGLKKLKVKVQPVVRPNLCEIIILKGMTCSPPCFCYTRANPGARTPALHPEPHSQRQQR